MPDLPTAQETVPGLTAIGWMGMVAPRGTPEPIVRQLSKDLRKVLEKPEIQAKLQQIGTPFRAVYGADFARFIDDEQKLWWPMIRQFNAR